ncbi:MAG: hypothetical protein IPM29_18145 [Planctomycetes bacterium]|nr:hypothetical protein [Planctomycetota bacterium]
MSHRSSLPDVGRARPAVRRALALLLALAPLGHTAAQDGAERPVVCIVGASVSAGFVNPFPRPDGERDESIALEPVLAVAWPDGAVRFVDRSETATFRAPRKIQEPRVATVAEEHPAVIVAVDFMFWFGYGYARGPDALERRLRLQRDGFELLGRFDAPLLVGDYPLVRDADPRMISPAQIPSRAEVERLNAALADWAASRPNVHLFGLGRMVEAAHDGGRRVAFEGREVLVPPAALLQGDGLHPTRVGVALLAADVIAALRAMLPEDHPARPREVPLAELLTAARAELAWDDVLADQPPPAAAPQPAGGAGGARRGAR